MLSLEGMEVVLPEGGLALWVWGIGPKGMLKLGHVLGGRGRWDCEGFGVLSVGARV